MNRGRVLIRVAGSLLIGVVASALTALLYAILTMTIYFQATKNCGFKCSEYFEQLPSQGPVLMEEKQTGPTIFKEIINHKFMCLNIQEKRRRCVLLQKVS